jgi:hypothetical protein
MNYYITHPKTVNKILKVLVKTEMKIGQLGLVNLVGLFKEYGHLVQAGMILTQLIVIKMEQS